MKSAGFLTIAPRLTVPYILSRAFLRHVERCHIILHVVNGASPDPIADLKAVNEELRSYSELLANKPQIVVLNKLDIPEVKRLYEFDPHDNLLCLFL